MKWAVFFCSKRTGLKCSRYISYIEDIEVICLMWVNLKCIVYVLDWIFFSIQYTVHFAFYYQCTLYVSIIFTYGICFYVFRHTPLLQTNSHPLHPSFQHFLLKSMCSCSEKGCNLPWKVHSLPKSPSHTFKVGPPPRPVIDGVISYNPYQ